MGRYINLLKNTLLFGLSTFSSKVLVFLLMPLYTRLLSPDEYGTMDLVQGTCNLIVPIISLSIHEAVIRFGLEKEHRKRDVYSTAIVTILIGYAALFAFLPLLRMISLISGYILLIYIYTLTAALRSTTTSFVRASGFTRVFALDGIFTTAVMVGLNLLFLIKFQMGATGYVLATILSDAASTLALTLLLKLHRFLRIRGFRRDTAKAMLRYCLPLMPTAIFWWITNLSDRYFVSYMLGVDVNGVYALAYKVPQLITLVSTIFIQAWQVSAFSEQNRRERERFFSTVFCSYYTLIFLGGSGLILLVKPIMGIMGEGYYAGWRYVPFLVLAVSFSCLVTFLGTVYNVAKKNSMVAVTTALGAILNLTLNFLLIPRYGANGASFATFASYFLVFVVRAVDTRKYERIRMQPVRIGLTLLLLLAQITVVLSAPPYWVAWEILIFLLIALCNFGYILFLLQHLTGLLSRIRSNSEEDPA